MYGLGGRVVCLARSCRELPPGNRRSGLLPALTSRNTAFASAFVRLRAGIWKEVARLDEEDLRAAASPASRSISKWEGISAWATN
jgi:hypothetical protein